MLAQVAQVIHSQEQFSVRAIQTGQLSQILFYNHRVPLMRNTFTGKPDNDTNDKRKSPADYDDIGAVFRKTLGHYTVRTTGENSIA
jgi:hypothetical protein